MNKFKFSSLLWLTPFVVSLVALTAAAAVAQPVSHTSIGAYYRSIDRIQARLALKKMRFGSPLFIRIFKTPGDLELWLLGSGGTFELYKRVPVCFNSGVLGPKTRAGDEQSPEGFYRVGPDQMNPRSNHHLSFNLGYPNEYDLAHNRTGSALMVHGRCSSTGCFAMTDYHMDEIYTIADAALASGQPEFAVHIFPFRLSADNLRTREGSPWIAFWRNLKEGYDLFEKHRLPPRVDVSGGRYVFFETAGYSLTRVNAPR